MIKSISVDNFRSLCNINDIEIKPITVLLGRNSCGKSSFLRLFPLFKQSISNKTRGAISLFGDLVYFGEINTVLNDLYKKQKEFIFFEFKGIIPESTSTIVTGHGRRRLKVRKIDYSISIKVKKYDEEDYLYISDMQLKYNDNIIDISLNVKTKKLTNFQINGISFLDKYPKLRLGYFTYTSLFPEFVYEYNRDTFFGNPETEILNETIKRNFENIFSDFQLIRTIQELEHDDNLNDKDVLRQKLKMTLDNDTEKCEIFENKVNNDPKILNEIGDALKLRDFITVYDVLTENLCREFINISYSKPLRANTERFYRNQPLSVNEVEPDGSNLVQFYLSMSNKQKNDFHLWMDTNFDFHYEVEKQTGFQSIIIKDAITGENHNINDMGFGFTQILPIVTQEWSLTNKTNNYYSRGRDTIFAIEQPELHLHPALQCKLIKAFANSIRIAVENNLSIRFIIETHSKTIVNYLGRLIERNEINNEYVSVLIFTKEKNVTEISKSTYNENGVLNDWPIGFFGE
ncbi:MAG: AAA family ATPase [Treponema sp.]|nr:AAA family ATPase [Treponema sp.]